MKPIRLTQSPFRYSSIITVVTMIGAGMFVPFIETQHPDIPFIGKLLFIGATSVIAWITAYIGLRLSNTLKLPSLTRIRRKRSVWRVLAVSGLIGFGIGLGAVAMTHLFHLPTNPGILAVRLATVVWSSVFLETVGHLFLQTIIYKYTKIQWVAVLIASFLLTVAFHSGGASDGATQQIVITGINFGAMVVTGGLYARYGFESAVVSHAVMHFVMLGLN